MKLILRDHLALHRTKLANHRTLLAYLRTALILFVTGLTLIKLFNSGSLFILGIFIFLLSVIFGIFGFFLYRKTNKRINNYYIK